MEKWRGVSQVICEGRVVRIPDVPSRSKPAGPVAMTQTVLTKVCGVPQPRIAVFLGGGDIRLATAEKLMAYFGLTVGGGR